MQTELVKKGMWAVITGASSGIGESMARELGREGVNLILVARRLDRLQILGAELKDKYQIEYQAIDADLSVPQETKRVFERATANGRMIQVLINNAGVGVYGPFMHYDVEQYSKTIQLNVTALTELTYYFVGHMQGHGKTSYISNVGSIASFLSVPYFSVYCATKHFVKEFTQTLNFELRKSNISVTLIAPGGTYSEFTEHSGQILKKSAHASMMSSELVARIGMDGMFKRRRYIVPGFLNSLMVHFPRFLPAKWMLALNDLAMRGAVDYKK
ncbi:MAG: SDR family oxidoreductase [Bdellovibrio sp.]|nr:SDR family oxidoreductase [Bdellovibrio sp.]